MKQLLSFLKSPVGRFHSSFAVFLLFNVISGLIGRTGYYPVLSKVHFISGLLILVAPVAYLIAMKNRSMIMKAFARMVWFKKADFAQRKTGSILFKAITLLLALVTLDNAIGGILYSLGVMRETAFQIHIVNFYIALGLLPLHALAGLLLHRKPSRKP